MFNNFPMESCKTMVMPPICLKHNKPMTSVYYEFGYNWICLECMKEVNKNIKPLTSEAVTPEPVPIHKFICTARDGAVKEFIAQKMEVSQGLVRLETDGNTIAVITLLPGESVIQSK